MRICIKNRWKSKAIPMTRGRFQLDLQLEVLHVWPWQGEKGMELEKAFLLYTIPTYFTTHKFIYQVWNYLFSLLKQQECKIGSGSDVLYEFASFSYFFPPTSLRDWLWVQQEEKSIISSGLSFLKDIHVRLFAANSFFSDCISIVYPSITLNYFLGHKQDDCFGYFLCIGM